jgi:hypothetical protein
MIYYRLKPLRRKKMAEKYMGEYYIPIFDKKVELYFGFDYDETGWGYVETPPTENEIKEYENALKYFIENINEIIKSIKEEAFKYYKGVKQPYAIDFEKEHSVIINDKEKHFEYMDLYSVRIVKNNKLKGSFVVLSIDYEIDEEHQMEILLKDKEVIKISEAAETYFWDIEGLKKIVPENIKRILDDNNV